MKAAKSSPMTTPRSFSARVHLTALLVVAVAFSTCNKVEPTKAIITVVDLDGHPVAGAYVKLYADPTYPLGDPSRLLKEGNTGNDGKVSFDYSEFYKQGQAGFAVLDIFASHDTLEAEGIIKVLEEEVNEEQVVLR
jgi:hypothetical protein